MQRKGWHMENLTTQKPTRNIALELVRVTEGAAMAAARHFGRGSKIEADKAAVDAMRFLLNEIDLDGTIIIGEGEKDKAPMLYNGEKVGTGELPVLDMAVDPVEGTTLVAKGMPNAIATIAAAPPGTMFNPGPMFYMSKIAPILIFEENENGIKIFDEKRFELLKGSAK